MAQSLEDKVALQVVQDLVITEIGVSWKVEDWFFLSLLIVLVVEYFDLASFDKVHLLDTALVTDDSFSRLVDPTVQVDNQLVNEPSLAFFKEVTKAFLELLELRCLHDELSLHLGCDLLEELELLNYQVVIVEEGLVDIILNIIIQIRLNMKRLVRFLDLLDPHIE